MAILKADDPCPDCAGALTDTNANITLLSSPPKKGVKCACGFSGFREATVTVEPDANGIDTVVYS